MRYKCSPAVKIVFTDSFLELVPESDDRNAIIQIIVNEQNNNSNVEGSKCN